MSEKKRNDNLRNQLVLTVIVLFSFFGMLFVARYTGNTPTGPEVVSVVSNTTGSLRATQQINVSGGLIYTILLNVTSQNPRWKAFVGNVSGAITLDNSNNYTIYDWALTFTGGEVYATRSSSVNWTLVNCTWGITNNVTNRSVERQENYVMNHTSPDDNITATFSTRNHSSFFVGAVEFQANSCYSLHTYVNDTPQAGSFHEVILFAGANTTDGSIIYTTILESDVRGYDNKLYDFQMIVPERGLSGFSSATAYNLYVELG